MNLEKASRYHRLLILSVLIYIVAVVLFMSTPEVVYLVLAILWLANLYFTPQLALALKKSALIWFALALIGPFIIWIPQLLLLNSANKIFRAEGLKIGFLGGARAP
ncbi:MAG: hypothetical protein AAGJ52_01770 [Pseudomonadota bacterium]